MIRQFGCSWVNNGGTRVNASFYGIWLDQLLAETVDGRAGNFIEGARAAFQVRELCLCQPEWQRLLQLDRDLAAKKRVHETLDALQQFSGRGFREGYSDNFSGMNASAQQQRNPASDQRGLSAARASLNE